MVARWKSMRWCERRRVCQGRGTIHPDARHAGGAAIRQARDKDLRGLNCISSNHDRKTGCGSMHVKDKVCVVTGAASGIGEAVARAYAQAGARGVVVADLRTSGDRLASGRKARSADLPCLRMLRRRPRYDR